MDSMRDRDNDIIGHQILFNKNRAYNQNLQYTPEKSVKYSEIKTNSGAFIRTNAIDCAYLSVFFSLIAKAHLSPLKIRQLGI